MNYLPQNTQVFTKGNQVKAIMGLNWNLIFSKQSQNSAAEKCKIFLMSPTVYRGFKRPAFRTEIPNDIIISAADQA